MAVSLSISIAQNSQSIANNTSNVTVKVVAKWTYGSYNHLQKAGWVKIDGTQYNFTNNFNTGETTSGSKTLYTKTVDIKHGTDGTKTLACSASYTTGVSSGTITASASKALTRIPRAATLLSAPNFNDEASPKITYSNPAGSAATTLQACIAGSDGSTIYAAYRDISKSGSEYTFSLTTAERTALRTAAKNVKSITVKFYVKTVIGGSTYYSSLAKTLSITNANPTISGFSVVNTDELTKTLTGNENTLVIGYSTPQVGATLTALKESTLKSYTLNGKATTISGASNLIRLDNVTVPSDGKFKLELVDSRGNKSTSTVTKSLVNYVKATCNFVSSPPTTGGNLEFTIKGNYFNKSFGAVANTLTIQYRYKVNDGSYGSWTTVTPTVTNNTYSAKVNLTGLDYQSKYTFHARAMDKLMTVYSKETALKTTPIFDWGENDFNFNVPVTMNHNGNTYNLLGLFRAMTTTYTPECDVTPGGNYSSATVTAHLTGCNLRIGLSAVRSASLAAGNFSNETVCTVDIDHGGKLANLYRVSFNTSTSGGVATLDCQATKVSDDVVRITISLCAAAQALTEFNAYFAMPCTIVTKAYV